MITYKWLNWINTFKFTWTLHAQQNNVCKNDVAKLTFWLIIYLNVNNKSIYQPIVQIFSAGFRTQHRSQNRVIHFRK